MTIRLIRVETMNRFFDFPFKAFGLLCFSLNRLSVWISWIPLSVLSNGIYYIFFQECFNLIPMFRWFLFFRWSLSYLSTRFATVKRQILCTAHRLEHQNMQRKKKKKTT